MPSSNDSRRMVPPSPESSVDWPKRTESTQAVLIGVEKWTLDPPNCTCHWASSFAEKKSLEQEKKQFTLKVLLECSKNTVFLQVSYISFTEIFDPKAVKMDLLIHRRMAWVWHRCFARLRYFGSVLHQRKGDLVLLPTVERSFSDSND